MRMFQWRLVLLCVCSQLAGNGVVCADTIPDGMSILAKILESRQSIQRGHVEIQTYSSGRKYQDFRKDWSIWFEGDTKRRSEVTKGAYTTAVCLDCYAERTELYYTTQPPTDPDTTMALVFYDGYGEPSPSRTVPNPRWFGCLVLGIENSHHYLSPLEIYGSKAEKYTEYPKVVSDMQANVDCWKVSFALEHIGHAIPPFTLPYTIWVDKSDVSRVLRVESRFKAEGILYVDGVDAESEKYKNEIWFPTKLTYRRIENGQVTESQDTQIKVISLNEPLREDTFTPQGISFLKPGTPASWAMERDRPVERGELVWDGNNVVAAGTFELDRIMRESVLLPPPSFCTENQPVSTE